jgi:hypothetical protein
MIGGVAMFSEQCNGAALTTVGDAMPTDQAFRKA